MTYLMPYLAPRPIDDDAWRVSVNSPGVAHYYGMAADFDGRSKCWAGEPVAGTRQAVDEDRLCPDCDSWYWQHLFRSSLSTPDPPDVPRPRVVGRVTALLGRGRRDRIRRRSDTLV
jgi:hypothetical protein